LENALTKPKAFDAKVLGMEKEALAGRLHDPIWRKPDKIGFSTRDTAKMSAMGFPVAA
jgi:hypothetical protein